MRKLFPAVWKNLLFLRPALVGYSWVKFPPLLNAIAFLPFLLPLTSHLSLVSLVFEIWSTSKILFHFLRKTILWKLISSKLSIFWKVDVVKFNFLLKENCPYLMALEILLLIGYSH